MHKREELEDQVVASLHSELLQSEEDSLKDILQNDPELNSFKDEMQSLHHALLNAPKIAMPIHKTISTMKATRPRKNYALYYSVAAAAVLFIVFNLILSKPPIKNNSPVAVSMTQIDTGKPFEQAYNWLQTNQTSNGNWSSELNQEKYSTGLTALSLLALVEKKDKNEEDQITINKALLWLKENQDESGRFGPDISNNLYNHGIATYALLKTESIQNNISKPMLIKALQFIVDNQSIKGGWGYSNEPDSINTSITVWQLQSLLLAKKLNLADHQKAIQNGFVWVKGISDRSGIAGYRKQGDYPYGKHTVTAMSGLFFKHYKELGIDPIEARINFQQALETFSKLPPEDINYYQCYFMADNMKHFNVKDKEAFGNQIRFALQKKQVQSGQSSGSWNPDDIWGYSGGRVYSTTMAIMALNSLN